MFGTLLFTTLFIALCVFKRRPQPALELSYDSLPRDIWDETNATPDWFFLACEYPRATVEAKPTDETNFNALMSIAVDTEVSGSSLTTSQRAENLSQYSLAELRDLAKDLKLPGWSRMRKADLAEKLAELNRPF